MLFNAHRSPQGRPTRQNCSSLLSPQTTSFDFGFGSGSRPPKYVCIVGDASRLNSTLWPVRLPLCADRRYMRISSLVHWILERRIATPHVTRQPPSVRSSTSTLSLGPSGRSWHLAPSTRHPVRVRVSPSLRIPIQPTHSSATQHTQRRASPARIARTPARPARSRVESRFADRLGLQWHYAL